MNYNRIQEDYACYQRKIEELQKEIEQMKFDMKILLIKLKLQGTSDQDQGKIK
jgi:hypothetical protein